MTTIELLHAAAAIIEDGIIGNDADTRHRQQVVEGLRRYVDILEHHPGREPQPEVEG